MVLSFGCLALKAGDNSIESNSWKEIRKLIEMSNKRIAPHNLCFIISKEWDLIHGYCFDCTHEDKADLEEFSSKLVLEYTPYVEGRTYQYYTGFNRMISSDRIVAVTDQFVAFRAKKHEERTAIATNENLVRAKVVLHYENLHKAMQQALNLN